MRKGQIDVQFNWVFILIIGGIILLFFFSLIGKQKEASDLHISANIRTDLSSIMTGSKVSTGTASLIEMFGDEIEYDCEGYRVGKLDPIRTHISFSPDVLKGRDLILWALDWNIPYRAANFVYITTPLIRYIIVDDTSGSMAEDVNFTLPPTHVLKDDLLRPFFSKELVSPTSLESIQDMNNYKVRFVFFSDPSSMADWSTVFNQITETEDTDITGVIIDGSTVEGAGTLTFLKVNSAGSGWEEYDPAANAYYLGIASIMAAVITENVEHYNCYMKNAFTHYDIVTSIYHNKSKTLSDYYLSTSNQRCPGEMNSAAAALQNMQTEIQTINADFPKPASQLYTYIQSFIQINDNIQKLSCAEVY